VLQASGKEKLTMITLISGGCIKIAVNWFLVAQPEINIYGAPVGTLVSYVIMALMDFVFICTTLKQTPRAIKALARPVVASALMGLAAWAVYGIMGRIIGTGSYMGLAASAGVAIIAAVAVYLICVIALRVITKEDMSLIPGGEKVAKILRMH
jgi:stage V sporulation protein B